MRKDRIERKDRKVNRKLKAAVVITSLFTVAFSAFSITSLVILNQTNTELSQRIDNYAEQIDSIENSQQEILLKYQGNAD